MEVYFCMSRSFWLIHVPFSVIADWRLVYRVVAQGGRSAPSLGFFQNWCHLEKQDGHHLEILFTHFNLKMLLVIDFKLDTVEGHNRALFWYVQDQSIHPVDMASTSVTIPDTDCTIFLLGCTTLVFLFMIGVIKKP